MFGLALRTLRFRITGFVAAFVAMFLGAAIVMACGGLVETGVRMAATPQMLAGAPVVVTGQQTYDGTALTERNRIDAGLVGAVAATPGVASAVPLVSFPASVAVGAPEPDAQGHNWSSAATAPYTLAEGVAPAGPGEVVLDQETAAAADVEVGASVPVTAHGSTTTYRVTGIAGSDASTSRPAVFFDDRTAGELAGAGGRIDAIGVRTAPGAEPATVAAAVTGTVGDRATVLTGDRRGLAELPGTLASQTTVTILGSIFGSWAVLIVMFGVASTLGLTLAQRGREMALLRAIGTTPDQIRRMIVGETLVLSVLATALAILPGLGLGRLLYGILTGSGVISPGVEFHLGWVPIVVGAVVAVAAAVVATIFAGRKSARTKPIAALDEGAANTTWYSRGRLFLALFCLANGIGLGVATVTVMTNGPSLASTAGPASVLVATGIVLLGPGITKAMIGALQWPLRALSPLSGFMAVRNALTNNVRMASAVTPVVLLIGIATGTLYMQATEDTVSEAGYTKAVRADYLLTSSTGGFAPGVVADVSGLPGVGAATGLVTTTGFVEGSGSVAMRGVDADAATQNLAVDPLAGSLDGLRGDTVALSDAAARSYGVGVGQTLPVRFGDGAAATLRVVALYADDPNQQFLLLPESTLAPHTTAGLPTQIMVRAAPGADPAALAGTLGGVVAGNPGTTVAGRDGLAAQNNTIQQILVSANYTIVAMIVGYAAITVINSLIAVTRKRRREFGLQRLTGATKGQVMAMLGMEGGMVAVVSTILGLVAAAATIVPYSLVKTGSPLPPVSGGIGVAVIGSAVLLIFGATLIPSWRGMSIPPIESVTRPD
jgi:putative ABC transport system permease protein